MVFLEYSIDWFASISALLFPIECKSVFPVWAETCKNFTFVLSSNALFKSNIFASTNDGQAQPNIYMIVIVMVIIILLIIMRTSKHLK